MPKTTINSPADTSSVESNTPGGDTQPAVIFMKVDGVDRLLGTMTVSADSEIEGSPDPHRAAVRQIKIDSQDIQVDDLDAERDLRGNGLSAKYAIQIIGDSIQYEDDENDGASLTISGETVKISFTENETIFAGAVSVVFSRFDILEAVPEADGSSEQSPLSGISGFIDAESSETIQVIDNPPDPVPSRNPIYEYVKIALPILLILALSIALALSFMKIRELRKKIQSLKKGSIHPPISTGRGETVSAVPKSEAVNLTLGKIHNIGKRPSQQDCLGCVEVRGGAFAVVADGMGGLSDGDKVSQKIVQTMLKDASNSTAPQIAENLLQMVAHANSEVNQILGYKTYQSGSTLVAVVAERSSFRWVSIGDSRIYLCRSGGLLQINREHIYKAELLCKAVNREMTFSEANSPEEGKKVTSFLGMGDIKYIDQCFSPIRAMPGDRVMLCSDGIFNVLSEQEISEILSRNQDASSAAAEIEQAVMVKNAQYQDNFSAVLLFYT